MSSISRSTLVSLGYTYPALAQLLPPAEEISCSFIRVGRRYYPRPELGWVDRAAVETALRAPAAKAWRAVRNRKRAEDGLSPIQSPAQYFVSQKRASAQVVRERNRKVAASNRELARTRKQLDIIRSARPDTILTVAPVAMHSANRRAKHLTKFENRETYSIKNAYLREVVALGQAKLYRYLHEGPAQYGTCVCDECGNSWVGRSMSDCFACHRGWGEVSGTQAETWYHVEVGEYRFHQPHRSAPIEWWSMSTPCEAHEPTQPRREIPMIRFRGHVLTPAATLALVARAIEILRGRTRIAEAA